MKIESRKVGFTLIKRVQEQEFEPFEIHVHDSCIVSDATQKEIHKLRKKMYKRLENELDGLIEKRLDALEDD